MIGRVSLFIFLLAGCLSIASADILVLTNQGNTPVPLSQNTNGAPSAGTSNVLSATQETDISMDEEVVRLVQKDHTFTVTCSFLMTSYSGKELTRTIGFPVAAVRYGDSMKRSFRVKVDDKPTQTELRMLRRTSTWEDEMYGKPDHERFQYPGYVTWTVDWEPFLTRHITCTYDMGEAERSWWPQLVSQYRLQYIVRTGALWREGTIGKADISIQFQSDPRPKKTDEASSPEAGLKQVFRLSYPDQAKWIGDREVQWHFENWKPTEDIVLEYAMWLGLRDDFFFKLPHPYQGDKKHYTNEFLDSLVESEIAPWKAIFPKETAELDKKQVKSTIAECLFHEITARHGDPFILGKASEKPHPKGVTIESGDGLLYGKWHRYFSDHYYFHGGWYRPNKETTVPDNELNEIERANRAFLKPLCRN